MCDLFRQNYVDIAFLIDYLHPMGANYWDIILTWGMMEESL
jgi:hypothetical protein